jgi:hypothetical protein
LFINYLIEQLKFKITAHAPSQGQVTLWENEWKASSQKLQSWLNPNYILCQFMVEWLLDVPLQNFSFFKWIWQKSKMPIYITIGNNLTYIGVYIFRNLWKASLKLQTLLNSIQWFDLYKHDKLDVFCADQKLKIVSSQDSSTFNMYCGPICGKCSMSSSVKPLRHLLWPNEIFMHFKDWSKYAVFRF